MLPFYLLPPPAGGTSLQEGGSKKGSLLEGAADEGGWRRSTAFVFTRYFHGSIKQKQPIKNSDEGAFGRLFSILSDYCSAFSHSLGRYSLVFCSISRNIFSPSFGLTVAICESFKNVASPKA